MHATIKEARHRRAAIKAATEGPCSQNKGALCLCAEQRAKQSSVGHANTKEKRKGIARGLTKPGVETAVPKGHMITQKRALTPGTHPLEFSGRGLLQTSRHRDTSSLPRTYTQGATPPFLSRPS